MDNRRSRRRFLVAVAVSLAGALGIGEFNLIELSAAVPPPPAAAPAGFFDAAIVRPVPMARAEYAAAEVPIIRAQPKG